MSNLKIVNLLRSGELPDNLADTNELLAEAGELLDDSYAHDILGEVVFLAEDGEYYVATVEVVIGKAHPQLVEDLLAEEI